MSNQILNHEPVLRLSFFGGILIMMMLWEAIAPLRKLKVSKSLRWLNNLGLVILNTLVLRAILPIATIELAAIADQNQWGLFNNISLLGWQILLLSILLLDLIIYLQHVLFHSLPTLWRIHKVHHADLDFDVTTGLRFHPLEILLSMGIKLAAILFLGTPAIAVLIFEALLNATSMFNHGNVRLPAWLESWLRLLIVTPDMHRIHHSVIPQETNSNFGFNLSWWDFLFGTYRDRTAVNQQKMNLGLAEFQNQLRVVQLPWMLLLPFINRIDR